MDSIVNNFISAINNHSADNIIKLVSDDHKFIDSSGIELSGKEKLRKAWTEYFKMFPDYKIEIEEIFFGNNTAAIIGKASGTFTKNGILKPKNKWQIPAAWYTVIHNDSIKIWQIFADVFPIIQIMDKEK
ncbi:MAG TPA: nuclear transport factor 2 family protein [Ignavibacteriaceae bacterium]|nr:nuclear transport factor 2 family protein [Ignavibacteriaceae bacterium]